MKQDIPIEYKFILLGDSSVGKSSIFSRLSGKPFSEKILSSIGIEKTIINFHALKINKNKKNIYKNFKIILFDTAGQERYRSIARTYFRDSHGIILIYSIIDEVSFEHIQIWLDSIKDSLNDWKRSGYIVMLLGNKLDIVEENMKRRVILAEEAERICSEQGIYWGGEFSAKEFEEKKIREIFEKFIRKIYLKLEGVNVNNNKEHIFKIQTGKKKTNFDKIKKYCCSPSL